MAAHVLDNAYISLNAVDLSDYIVSISVRANHEEIDMTAMGDDAMTRIAGLDDWEIEVTYHQDFAASKVDATVYGVWNGKVGVVVIVKAENAAVGPTNPTWTGTGQIFDYEPISGSIGQAHDVTVVIKASAGTALVRATS